MNSSIILDSLVGHLNNGFGHTSNSTQRDREWNIIKDAAANVDINIINPGSWINNASPVVSMISKHIDKWHPHTGANSDLIAHYGQSLVLAQAFGANASTGIGLAVELFDGEVEWWGKESRKGGAGYSNDDLAADLAGAYGYTPSQALAAGLLTHTSAEELDNDYFLDGNTGFLDNIHKLWDLWDADVTDQSAADKADAETMMDSLMTKLQASHSGYIVAGWRSYSVVLASSEANAQDGLGYKGDVWSGIHDVNNENLSTGFSMVDAYDVDQTWISRAVTLTWPASEYVSVITHDANKLNMIVSVPAGSAAISFDPQISSNLTKAWPVAVSYSVVN